MPKHLVGRSGTSFIGATLHDDPDCPTIGDAGVRPLADSTVESLDADEYELCPTCHDVGNDSDTTGDDGDESLHPEGSPAAEGEPLPDVETLIEQGVCPWCDDYEGDHVGQHASSAHPEQWAAYKD